MKKGDRVEITNKATYNGQDMDWTERQTGKTTLLAGTKIYHSSDKKINAFFPKLTCFFINYYAPSFVYCAVLKNNITVPTFDNEVRIDLEKHMDDIEIYYIGIAKYIWSKNEFGNDVCTKKNNVMKEFDVIEE